jgi:uncharacterized RDD family membrane protein YckC
MSAPDIASPNARHRRSLITPEGVDLQVEVASAGERISALLLDLAMMAGVAIVATIACLMLASAMDFNAAEAVFVIWILGLFLLRNAWFLLFEMSARAATPGKRIVGLRVAARGGGRLRFEAVFARNALRELEVFLPLSVLLSAPVAAQAGGGDGWMVLLLVLWCLTFVLLPLFNRDRLRAGDMVAGTWVLRSPRQKLLADMADHGAVNRPAFTFTTAQLDAYGVKELQVLEQVLRTRERATVRAVADRIAAKTDYVRDSASDLEFLQAYYHALRERLEARLLMGRRRRDKFDVEG